MELSEHYCEQKAVKSGSSFYYSFLFLPTEQRKAITALYAFCREVDDIVDECSEKEVAQQKITWWHHEIERVYSGAPQHPIGQALKKAQQDFQLPQLLFHEILQGMLMDLDYQGYATFDDLSVYCHCVASAPGLLAARIFGYTDPSTLEYAKNLGVAFQLVNIIRDVGEDLQRNRIYLPEEELKKFSLDNTDILEKNYSQNFVKLMQFQTQRARDYYQKSLNALPNTDRQSQKAGLIMAEIYFTLLSEIEKSNFKVFDQKIRLTPLRKFWIAWKTARRVKKRA